MHDLMTLIPMMWDRSHISTSSHDFLSEISGTQAWRIALVHRVGTLLRAMTGAARGTRRRGSI